MSSPITHKWTIDNFTYLYNRDQFSTSDGEFYVESDIFPKAENNNNPEAQFSLQLFPNGLKNGDQSKFTSIIVQLHDEEKSVNEKFNLQVTILNELEESIYTKEIKHKFSSKSYECKIEQFVERSFLVDSIKKLDKIILEIKIVPIKLQLNILNNSNNETQNIEEISSSTFNPKVESFGFEWTIENFHQFLLNDNARKSDQFYIDSKSFNSFQNNQKFHLRLYPLGEKERLFVGLFLCLEKNVEKNLGPKKIRFKFSIIDSSGKRQNSKYKEEIFSEIGYGFAKFVSHNLLQRSLFLFDEKNLKIFCQVEICDPNVSSSKIAEQNYQRIFNRKISTDIPTIQRSFDAQLHNITPFAYQWTVDNYAALKKVKSEPFSPPNFENLKFYIKIYPKGHGRKNRDHLSVYLGLKISTPINALYKFSLLNCCEIDNKLNTKADVANFDRKYQWFGFPKYISNLDAARKVLCKTGRLILLCEVALVENNAETKKISQVNMQNYCRIFEAQNSTNSVSPIAIGCHFDKKNSLKRTVSDKFRGFNLNLNKK